MTLKLLKKNYLITNMGLRPCYRTQKKDPAAGARKKTFLDPEQDLLFSFGLEIVQVVISDNVYSVMPQVFRYDSHSFLVEHFALHIPSADISIRFWNLPSCQALI